MPTTILNTDFVESIHRAVARGRQVDEVVQQIDVVTLPGLLEYGCLRYAEPNLVPELPEYVYNSNIGRALRQVPSLLGVGVIRVPRIPIKGLESQPAEFHLLRPAEDLDSDVQWESFLARFERSARAAGFTSLAASKLQSAFFEMSENALLHSCSPVTPLVGYAVSRTFAQFCVVDAGIGVRASLIKNPRFARLSDDVEAIQLALQTGTTSTQEGMGGFGFQSVFKALAEQWGELRFRSGSGCISMDGKGVSADLCRRHRPPSLPGFQVSVCCSTGAGGPPVSQF